MRLSPLLPLMLLLSACTSGSATYRLDGADQTLSIRAEQEYFWSDALTVKMITARLPDCQRQVTLAKLPKNEFEIELFDSGDNVYTLRAGEQMWQVNVESCTPLGEPKQAVSGLPVGTFKFDADKRVVFVKNPAAK